MWMWNVCVCGCVECMCEMYAIAAVSNAFCILSDAGRRREYDAYGSQMANTDHSTFREHPYAAQNTNRHRRARRPDEEEEEFEYYDYTRGFESTFLLFFHLLFSYFSHPFSTSLQYPIHASYSSSYSGWVLP